MYHLKFSDPAKRSLRILDKSVSVRILRKLNWLTENAESTKPEGLRGDMSGFSKLREGDYRVLYELFHDDNCFTTIR